MQKGRFDSTTGKQEVETEGTGTSGLEYNATPPTVSDGGTGSAQGDENLNTKVTLATALAGILEGSENDTILSSLFRRSDAWQDFDVDTDLTTQEVVQAGVASKRIYITDIIVSVSAAMDITIQDEDDAKVFPVLYFPSKGVFSKKLATPIMLGIDKDLEIKSSASGNVSWGMLGYQK